MANSLPRYLKTLALIVTPILITQVFLYLMTFFDILMTSQYDIGHLAGVSIGSSLWVPVYTGLTGILISITPIVAHYIGGNKKDQVRPSVQQGILVAIGMSLLVYILVFTFAESVVNAMDVTAIEREIAIAYMKTISIGLVPLFIYSVLRGFIDALGLTRVTMFITLLSAPINIFLNYLFIFGNWGAPELGGQGAALASALTYWLVLAITISLIVLLPSIKEYRIFSGFVGVQKKRIWTIVAMGVPIGLSIFAETTIFSAVTLVMTNYSTEVLSAHQIALNFTSLLYMIPLSIAMGATIVVGQAVGAEKRNEAKHYAWLAVSLAIGVSFISASILYFYREQISGFYTDDATVVAYAVQFLVFAALFQLSDAIQAPVQGALRGYKDVKITFIMAIISYWVIGLPLGYVLATYTEFAQYGYWVGLIAGLTAGAITLSIRLVIVQRKPHVG
ncbi:MATE family efflux transporter [Chryseomicrobium excrementi]|uniref:Probable multidrug resistance protein NorM n=1 Tax=Chryseomicrobium excrementi TaxID=2041346 RepID=A0A2M9F2J7_9BACL|nr:MATE family efflux transporter [Chryseomicrobium excrementi]PJK17686.1 MATE family efflux transporter [Chryseomicrobium excrementi]